MQPRSILVISMVVLVPLLLWAGADILEFSAEPQGEAAVLLTWRTGVEVSLSMFQIQRSTNGTTFYTIGEKDPTGSYSEYQYLDTNLLKQAVKTYYYRLKMIDTSGTVTYSEVCDVTMTFSGIQQTWGSIKAMFR